jgi:hypothetical protein
MLQEAGSILECEEHGWAKDGADPHAPNGLSPDQAVAEVREVLDSIGDTCPECTP